MANKRIINPICLDGIATTPENRPTPFGEYGAVMNFCVGQGANQKLYCIKDEIVAHYSGAFRSVVGQGGVVHLPGENGQIFGLVFHFMIHKKFFQFAKDDVERDKKPGFLISFEAITEIYDIGRRYLMPLVQNAAIDLYVNKIRYGKVLPDEGGVQYLWTMTPPGCTLRRLLVDLVREMWVPDGNRFPFWNKLVGGKSLKPDDLVMAIEELDHSTHTVRISAKTTTRLLACEWHDHEKTDVCEGSEDYALLPEHLLPR